MYEHLCVQICALRSARAHTLSPLPCLLVRLIVELICISVQV